MGMDLPANTVLNHYRIASKLGAGGMGEVYRARDLRLERDVAIKVLPTSFASDEDRLRRFEQEARATSALTHPNILTVYDVGSHEDRPYIVAELLEGEDLRCRLNGGAIPQRKAIDYAQQIASGLAAAHAKGIIHRDLKPENVFITTDGRVKILDFGLAKKTPITPSAQADSDIATQEAITQPGIVLGTFAYMSPEQVRGQTADHRSDIFSFGTVLFEMVRGRRPFSGKSAIEVMNAILNAEPEPPPAANSQINPALERIVSRCLEKGVDGRFQSASDLCFAIESISFASGSGQESEVPAAVEISKRHLLWSARVAWLVAALLLATTLALVWILNGRKAPTSAGIVRLSLRPPADSTFFSVSREASPPALSADGRLVAFVAQKPDGKRQLFVRALDSLSPQALAGTEGAAHPFWSPDGRYIGFFAHGKLNRVAATGGAVLALCDAPSGYGGSWNSAGVIVFSPAGASALQKVSADGGTPSLATDLGNEGGGVSHLWPCFLPDGRHFLFLRRRFATGASGQDTIQVGSLDSKEARPVVQVSSSVSYSEGYILYQRAGLLLAQQLDIGRVRTVGDPFPVVARINYEITTSRGMFALSEAGVLLYEAGPGASGYQLTWLDRSGAIHGLLGNPNNYFSPNPVFSPDGKSIAIQMQNSANPVGSDIWIFDTARSVATRFTSDPVSHRAPLWSPDGSRIVFGSTRKGKVDLYQKLASGIGDEEVLLETDFDKYPLSWSPDGRFILYQEIEPRMGSNIWVLPLSGEKPFPFLRTEFNEINPTFSPDGHWVAYQSDVSGRDEIYAAPFPGPGAKLQISAAGGMWPKWRGDSKEVFYLSPNNHLMAAEVKADRLSIEVGTTRELFEAHATGPGYFYNVAPDGQRFLVNRVVEQLPMVVVLNWSPTLKR
jgi:serine/threonine protein kinase